MARKKRQDSVEARVEVLQAKDVEVPSHMELHPEVEPFFSNVIAEFARSEWTAHQVELAVMLARLMWRLNAVQMQIAEQGETAKSDRGTPVINPLVTVAKSYAGDINALRRGLALNARARANGDSRNIATASAIAKSTESTLDDDLLARVH